MVPLGALPPLAPLPLLSPLGLLCVLVLLVGGLVPPPSGTRSNYQQQNQDWAICGTGFGRKVTRAKLQEFAAEVMQDFPPDVIEDGTFWAYSFSKYFLVKFTSKANFLTALDYLKTRSAPYMFEDEIDGEEKKIWVRRNKPLVEIKIGPVQQPLLHRSLHHVQGH